MDTANILNLYDDVKDNIKFITASSVRTKIILSLIQETKNLTALKNELNFESSSALRELKKLEDRDIIYKKENEYSLSSFGKVYATRSKDLFEFIYVIKKHEKIFLGHHIDGIPSDLLREIKHLKDSSIIESTPLNIIKPHTNYAKLLSDALSIKGVSPIFYYPYIDLYTKKLKENADVDLILTPLILDKVLETANKENIKKVLKSGILKLWKIDEDVKIAFTVTDKFLSLGLFSADGLYDATMNLVSFDEDAIKWGNELFDYYLRKAHRFELEHSDMY